MAKNGKLTKTKNPMRLSVMAEGPVTVSFKKGDQKWYCTALEFDLVGIGKTREKAFDELREILNIYLDAVIKSRHKVAFYNPAEGEEWANPDKERYIVSILLTKKRSTEIPLRLHIDEARQFRRQIRSFDLIPAAA